MKLMKNCSRNYLYAVLAFVLTLIFFSLPVTYADASDTSGSYQHIFDDAGLLSTKEKKDLEEMCIEYGDRAGIEIMILTHNNPRAKSAEYYLEDFNDTLPDSDRVLLLIDMYNRDVLIEGYGLAEDYINSKRIDVIIKDITPYLSDGAYVKAFQHYIEASANYMADDSLINQDHNYNYNNDNGRYGNSTADRILTNLWFQIIVSLVIGAITVSIMAYNSGGRITVNSNTYMDHSKSGLIGRRDSYIRTRVTRIRKPQDNNNSKGNFNAGGFRGGVSSGGRSHSSGGGKF